MLQIAAHGQTMRRSFQEICEGEDPWIALGDFTNDFLYYYPYLREALVEDPLQEAEVPPEFHHWAVFCAASVEYLCHTYNLPVPTWIDNYTPLPDAWFFSPAASVDESIRERYVQTTPPEFQKWNIYCGDTVYMDKRKAAEAFRQKLKAIA